MHSIKRCTEFCRPARDSLERGTGRRRRLIIIGLRTNRCEIARTRLFASLTFRSARLFAHSLARSPYSRSRALRDYLCCRRASSPIRADEFIVRGVVGPGNAAARLSPPSPTTPRRINPFFASLLYVVRAGSYDENRRTWVCLCTAATRYIRLHIRCVM